MLRIAATQTEYAHSETYPFIHPDDVFQLHHMEDQRYSLGTNLEEPTSDDVTDNSETIALVGESENAWGVGLLYIIIVVTQEEFSLEDVESKSTYTIGPFLKGKISHNLRKMRLE